MVVSRVFNEYVTDVIRHYNVMYMKHSVAYLSYK